MPLAADARSPMLGRRFVVTVLSEAGAGEQAADAALLVTELVTNAVVHAGTPVTLSVKVDPDAVLITVSDRGNGPLLARSKAELSEGGRGIWMVHETATAWGTRHDARGTTVWFRLDRQAGLHGVDAVDGAVALASSPGVDVPTQEADLDRTVAPPSSLEGSWEGSWEAVQWLLQVADDGATVSAAMVQEQLARTLDATGADAAALVAWGPFDGREVITLGLPEDVTESLQEVRSDQEVHEILQRRRPLELMQLRLPGARQGSLTLGWRTDPPQSSALPLAHLAAGRLGLLLRVKRLEEADHRRRGFEAMLAEASELLGASLDPDLTAALVPSLVVPRLARWAAVHLAGDEGELTLAAVSHVNEDAVPALRERLTAVGDVGIGSAVVAGLGEIVVFPLTARRRTLGRLTLGLDSRGALRPDAHAVADDLARRAALALDNARTHREQLDLARALQAALLPPQLPRDDFVEFGAQYVAAGEGAVVGGDFYDVVDLPGGGFGIIIGDVQGKGPTAATVTGVVREIVRLLLTQGRPLPDVLQQLNAVLLKHRPSRFCTAVLARLDGHRLSLCVAGHPSPLLIRPEQPPAFVGGAGALLGVMDQIDVQEVTVALSPGDVLLLYTDGLLERRDGSRMLGEAGVLRLAEACRGHSAVSVANTVLQGAIEFTPAPLRDDIALLAMRALPPTSDST